MFDLASLQNAVFTDSLVRLNTMEPGIIEQDDG
jgi:hypothetical protein